jgi:cupin 2 domain-containing protein
MKNLLKNIPTALPKEHFESLVQAENIHIERIVSKGHTSPDEGWHEQADNEFVLLLKGAARLEFVDGRVVSMGPGDWLEIPAQVKHRVVWTTGDVETVWLAVHYPQT